jgi:tRNA modification GTPase
MPRNSQHPSTAVLLTPPGGAAIAVVRLAGPGVADFLRRHFDKAPAAGRCVHGTLSEAGRVLDDPVVTVTGDGTVADVSLHGGPWVVRSVLELARRDGFDVIDRPDVPLPEAAVDGDTPVWREVEQYLPLATTELALRTLLAQPVAWRELGRSAPTHEQSERMLVDRSLHWLLRPPRVAIVGVPNVGKSTLANQLFGAQRVITADVPGTTRDWVGEVANLDGLAVMLVDTPGTRATDDPIEREAIERSGEQVAAADLIVLVLDPTQPREPAQAELERNYRGALRVVNKSDRAGAWEGDGWDIRTVATTGEGIDALRGAIRRRFLGAESIDVTQPRCWTPRQRELLERFRQTGIWSARGVTA